MEKEINVFRSFTVVVLYTKLSPKLPACMDDAILHGKPFRGIALI